MSLINVWIEHNAISLNQPFTYHCDQAVSRGCRVKVPFGNKECIGFVEAVDVESSVSNLKDVIEVIDEKPLLNEELMSLADFMSDFYVCSKISCLKTMLPPALKPSSSAHKVIYEDWAVKGNPDSLTKRQQEVFDEISERLPMKASEFRKLAKSQAKNLIDKNAVILEKREKKPELFMEEGIDTNFALTDEQISAVNIIQSGKDQIYLLHGVTGSGKTEIFLQLADVVLKQGRQVLFLVPEIGLTPMMISRIKARFKKRIAIYHSGLNAQEKYDQYKIVQSGEANIVVGTRSAVFMPFQDLGLILMDEEHDTSYKQDNTPRYHTRDIVLERSKNHGCKVVFASATPSLESYARAYKGVYHLVELKERIHKQMPEILLTDMKKENVKNGISQFLSDQIQIRLNRHEQVILLLNRRGYLPVVQCMDCTHVITCPECGLAMTYHKASRSVVCHCCGRIEPFNGTCPSCHSTKFHRLGMGTERLEENLKEMYPQANIVRMDADTTRKKNAHNKILKEFEDNGDILIGTQMVAKGLDFERVTLVGIINADAALARVDYRSSEIAYQMLEQASGRSGRGELPGQVIIQTYDPSHYVMKSIVTHSYLSFFTTEMNYRHLGMYPPYVYLAVIIYSHADVQKAMNSANAVKEYLSDMKVLGPVEISMRQRLKRVRLVIKSSNITVLKNRVWDAVNYHMSLKSNVKQDINMHPLLLED